VEFPRYDHQASKARIEYLSIQMKRATRLASLPGMEQMHERSSLSSD
jgi:hypothetical protein